MNKTPYDQSFTPAESIHHRPGGVDALSRLAAQVDELTRERDQLAASVERFRDALRFSLDLADQAPQSFYFVSEMARCHDLLLETQPAALAEIRAQAVEDACKEAMPGPPNPPDDPPYGYNEFCEGVMAVSQAAQSIRQEKEGE